VEPPVRRREPTAGQKCLIRHQVASPRVTPATPVTALQGGLLGRVATPLDLSPPTAH
jgi:hypothetical protein